METDKTGMIFAGVILTAVLTFGAIQFTDSEELRTAGCENENMELHQPFGQAESSMKKSNVSISYASGDNITYDDTKNISITIHDAASERSIHFSWKQFGSYPVVPGDTIVIPEGSLPKYVNEKDSITITWYGYNSAIPDDCERKLINSELLSSEISN